jgi:hypothetical protein
MTAKHPGADQSESQWNRLMQEYDIALKLLLQGSAKLTLRELTGTAIEKWLNVELPRVQNPRVDLLGVTADGSLVHFELQSLNEAAIPLRLAEYSLGAYRLFGKFPRQIVLYVGEAPMRMATELHGPMCGSSSALLTFAIWMGSDCSRAMKSEIM